MSPQCLLLWWPSWMSEWNKFISSESSCLPDASHQVSLNPTYRSRADVVLWFSRWPPWWPSWILELNFFVSILKPQCIPPSLGSVGLTVREQTWLEIFKMTTVAAILDIVTEWFWSFWISMLLRCFPSSFSSSLLTVWEEILDIGMEWF